MMSSRRNLGMGLAFVGHAGLAVAMGQTFGHTAGEIYFLAGVSFAALIAGVDILLDHIVDKKFERWEKQKGNLRVIEGGKDKAA